MARRSKQRSTTKTTPAATQKMPGQVKADAELVSNIMDEIKRLDSQAIAHDSQRIFGIGNVVVDRLYGGDLGAAEKTGKRHATYRALAKDPHLPISHCHLWKAVNVVIQRPHLPSECRDGLSATHQMSLLSVKDAEVRNQLALEALNEKLSKRALEQRIKDWRKNQTTKTGGRKPMSALDQLRKHTAAAAAVVATRSDELLADDIPTAEFQEANKDLNCHLGVLTRLCDEIAYLLGAEPGTVPVESPFVSPVKQTANHTSTAGMEMAATNGDGSHAEMATTHDQFEFTGIPEYEPEDEFVEVDV